ncbi:hypothetical protein VSR68_32205 [Paraburkholderia phymatum]|uniref:hypothetical protein n=1 Tax=Paraburkholderia phymatum TaxID=148447 RepID=UPI00317F8FB5
MQSGYAAAAVASALVVIYVHSTIPRYTVRGSRRVIAHLSLAVVGILFGVVSAMVFGSVASPWLVLVVGFGVVHVPAACVLAIKHLRHSGKS